MKNLTYQIYLAHPGVREQIEREVRVARAQAMRQYVVAPIANMFRRMFSRAHPAQATSLQISV